MYSTLILLAGSTGLLFVWGVLDVITARRERRDEAGASAMRGGWFWSYKDGIFLIMLAVLDGKAAFDAQQSMSQIEARLAPRRLTREQQQHFREALAHTPKMPVKILINTDVTPREKDEQYTFADDIQRALVSAGWVVDVEAVIFPRRPRLPGGLAVWGVPSATRDGVGGALEALGLFPTVGHVNAEDLVGAPVSSDLIRIDVSSRPPPS